MIFLLGVGKRETIRYRIRKVNETRPALPEKMSAARRLPR
jgi:hypothetical protein